MGIARPDARGATTRYLTSATHRVTVVPSIPDPTYQSHCHLSQRYITSPRLLQHCKMVLMVVGALLGVTKIRYSHTFIDSLVFRLHYRWTAAACLMAAAFITAKDFIGTPIECMINSNNAPKPIVTYCWIQSTYTINSTVGATGIPGIGHYLPKIHEKTVLGYYQWVHVVLFLQACLFYLPHMIWKAMEGKQVDLLLQDLNKTLFDDGAEGKKKNIIKYLKESWGMNTKYSVGYFVCEILNLVNVVGQMCLMNKFLGGVFMDYGTRVFGLSDMDDQLRTDPMIEIFPRMAKCDFHMFGSSGSIEKKDALCVLPQNIINEKVYLVMWLWFIILMVLTSLQILLRGVIFYSSFLRVRMLSHRIKMPATANLEQMVRHMQLGDYCLLDSIGRNLDVVHFRDVLEGVIKASEEVVPSAPPAKEVYMPLYPVLGEGTLPRKRHVDQPDTIIQ